VFDPTPLDKEVLVPGAEDHWASDVEITPDGKHLYAVERSTKKAFHFDVAKDGTLQPSGDAVTVGEAVRVFGISPSGKSLQIGDAQGNLVGFVVNPVSGALSAAKEPFKAGAALNGTVIRAVR
jgi:6-phosphogluconolactonase (cycloisomerase 2 family)